MNVAQATLTIFCDDGTTPWIQAFVTARDVNGHFTIDIDGIPEDFVPVRKYYKTDDKALADLFLRVDFVQSIIEDAFETKPRAEYWFRPRRMKPALA